jgi:hypothetical protein
MATITISNLHPTGSDLFSDSESYLRELSNEDIVQVQGGSTLVCSVVASVSVVASAAISVAFALDAIFD